MMVENIQEYTSEAKPAFRSGASKMKKGHLSALMDILLKFASFFLFNYKICPDNAVLSKQ